MTTMDSKRRALGRGLESLLPSRRVEAPVAIIASAVPEDTSGKPLEIALDKIERNPYQTRTSFDPEKLTELAQSIEANGVVQPVVVRPLPDGRYQLITGERRLMASQQVGRATIPAIVRIVSDMQAMEMTIVENLQRADLNPMEQARAFQRLSTEFRMTQEQMALRTGMSRAGVANFIRILKLPDEIQKVVEMGGLSFGHAKLLLGLPRSSDMVTAAKMILARSMSVRQFEEWLQSTMNPEAKPARQEKVKEPRDANVQEAQDLLQRSLGLRVRVDDKGGKGRVIIEYANLEDFDLLMLALSDGREPS